MTSFSRFLSAFIYVIQRRDPLCIPQGPDLLLTFWKRPAGGALPLGRLCSSVREEGGCGVQMGKIMPHHMLPSFNAVLRDHYTWLRYPQLHGHFTLFWVGLEVSAQIRLGFQIWFDQSPPQRKHGSGPSHLPHRYIISIYFSFEVEFTTHDDVIYFIEYDVSILSIRQIWMAKIFFFFSFFTEKC